MAHGAVGGVKLAPLRLINEAILGSEELGLQSEYVYRHHQALQIMAQDLRERFIGTPDNGLRG